MENNNSWILFGAGDEGKKIASILKKTLNKVYAFCDNDESKVGTFIGDKTVISFDEMCKIYREHKIVISVSQMYEEELIKQLHNAGIEEYLKLDEAYNSIEYKSYKELEQFKNIHYGKRCFVIGTGPSLKISDLEMLKKKGEITFAPNRIFNIYDETSWRPDYYFVADTKIICQYYEEILNIKDCDVFINEIEYYEACKNLDRKRFDKEGFYCFTRCNMWEYEEKLNMALPSFSMDPSKYIVDGATVIYIMIQWAVYMGFKEIYLLGVDFSYNDMTGLSNEDHFGKKYLREGEIVNPPNLDKSGRAYVKSLLISEKGDFKIYNATRGGKLEIFERIDIDDLLNCEEDGIDNEQ